MSFFLGGGVIKCLMVSSMLFQKCVNVVSSCLKIFQWSIKGVLLVYAGCFKS